MFYCVLGFIGFIAGFMMRMLDAVRKY